MDISTIAGIAARWGTEEQADDLLRTALPELTAITGATAAFAVRHEVSGPRVLATTGVELTPPDASPEAGPIDVPEEWAAQGITHATALLLDTDVLVLAGAAPLDLERPDTAAALWLLRNAYSRTHLADQLRDLQTRVDNAQQLAGMGDYDWHIASNTNRWSDHLYRIYGHEPQSFNASYERFLGLIHPEDRDRIQEIHGQAYATGEPYQMIERIIRPDGEMRYLSSNGQVIMNAAGTPERMRGTCVDITEQVLAKQAEEHSHARFRALVEGCPDAIVVFGNDGVVVQANAHAAELLGADPIGRAVADFLPSTDTGLGVAGTSLAGGSLLLDLATVELRGPGGDHLNATYLRDATTRVDGEAVAAHFRESQVRRRQALELNDSVIQGLTASILAMQAGDEETSSYYLGSTLISARRMMNEWLAPLEGSDLEPGDLIRSTPSTIGDVTAVTELPGRAPTRILLVDDNEDVRRLLRLKLEDNDGYEVIGEAADGEQAVELATNLQPSVVILDLAMPKMDGLQALPLILDAVTGVRVIVLSGFDEDSMADRAFQAGAHAYLEKGLRMDLDGAIKTVLKETA